jgi:arabinogalactan endo-1,4-beta-galactosidase
MNHRFTDRVCVAGATGVSAFVFLAAVSACGVGQGGAGNEPGASTGPGSGTSASTSGATPSQSGSSASATSASASSAVTNSSGSTGASGSTGSSGADGGTGSGSGADASADAGGATNLPSYFIGADVTDQEPAGTTAINNLFTSMKANGFNFVRVRTFVDPKASDGYDKTNGFDDITHTVAFGKLIKDAGMGLLLDFHMSDNWADPGKQCVPVAWQGLTTITDLANALQAYVTASITALVAGGARPDMVQIGNETTPGMLLHICDSGGQPTGTAPRVTGAASTAGWPNLGLLLKAGIAGVKAVDPTILISFHIDKGNSFSASKSWLDNAIKQGATPDTFGESSYQLYQGDPNSQANTQNGWQTTYSQLAAAYPKIRFFAAEYGPMERQINDVVFGLPNGQGLGTFNWEPTTQGAWNASVASDPAGTATHALWQRSGNNYTALPDLALYPPMKTAYASRL